MNFIIAVFFGWQIKELTEITPIAKRNKINAVKTGKN
jgi:hypothetical protein